MLRHKRYTVGRDSSANIYAAVTYTANRSGPSRMSKPSRQTGYQKEVYTVHCSADKRSEDKRDESERSALHSNENGKQSGTYKSEDKENERAFHLVVE